MHILPALLNNKQHVYIRPATTHEEYIEEENRENRWHSQKTVKLEPLVCVFYLNRRVFYLIAC